MFTSLVYKVCRTSGWYVFCLTTEGWQLLDCFSLEERPVIDLWLTRLNAQQVSPTGWGNPVDEFYISHEVL